MTLKTTVNPDFYLPYTQGKYMEVPYQKSLEEALAHYPELANVPIVFKEKPSILPMKSRPKPGSFLGFRKRRVYEVTISNKTINELAPALMMNLNNESKVGLFGLALAKIICYQRMTFWQLLRYNLQTLFFNHKGALERRANLVTIRHGLGWQLYEWSREMRKMEIGNPVLEKLNSHHLEPEEIIKAIQSTYEVIKQN